MHLASWPLPQFEFGARSIPLSIFMCQSMALRMRVKTDIDYLEPSLLRPCCVVSVTRVDDIGDARCCATCQACVNDDKHLRKSGLC